MGKELGVSAGGMDGIGYMYGVDDGCRRWGSFFTQKDANSQLSVGSSKKRRTLRVRSE